MPTISSHIRNVLRRLNRLTIPILTPLLLLVSLSVSAVAFFYPLEFETRESTVWLHVLALKQGINIYNHSQVAFVNMNHGPFDPLFKLVIASLFPFLQSWHITRFAVLLLPYIFIVLAWKLIAKVSTKSFLHALYLGSIGYLSLLVISDDIFLTGRSDATAAVLLLLLVYISIAYSPKTDLTTALHGLVCGTIGTSVILTNWRIAPTILALLIFIIWIYKNVNAATGRHIVIYLLSFITASLGIWVLTLHYFFNFDLVLYYTHFFGLYTRAAGWGPGIFGRSVLLFIILLFYKPLLLASAFYLLTPARNQRVNKAWVLLSCIVFVSCALAYYLNYYGGGTHYFVPFMIILWFFYATNYAAEHRQRLTLLGISLVAFTFLRLAPVLMNMQTLDTMALKSNQAYSLKTLVRRLVKEEDKWNPFQNTLKRAYTMNQASSFMTLVRTLAETNTILSEDAFFFRTSYKGELIDMGDTVSVLKGYYGEEFSRTVEYHFDRVQRHPPDYILTGFTESPELRKVIEKKYILIAEGPDNLTANAWKKSRLFKRAEN